MLFGVEMPLATLPALLLAMACGATMLAALGLMLSVYVRQLENFAGTMNFVIFPMFFISPALYPLWKLEESGAWWMLKLAEFNPFTYAVEAIRYAMVGQFHGLSWAVVLGCSVVFFVLALVGLRPAARLDSEKGFGLSSVVRRAGRTWRQT